MERRDYLFNVLTLGRETNEGSITPLSPNTHTLHLPFPPIIDQVLSLAPVCGLTHSSPGWDQAPASPLPSVDPSKSPVLALCRLVVQQPRAQVSLLRMCSPSCPWASSGSLLSSWPWGQMEAHWFLSQAGQMDSSLVVPLPPSFSRTSCQIMLCKILGI